MLLRKMLITAAMLQLMIAPGMTQIVKPDSEHRYQGGPKTEEYAMRNARASTDYKYNFTGSDVPQYNAHRYYGGPKGH